MRPVAFSVKKGLHLLVAFEGDYSSGFVSGVELTHPDRSTPWREPLRAEVSGRALVGRLASLTRERGCYGIWVLTDDKNAAASATNTPTDGRVKTGQVVVVWTS